jgi:transposase
MAPLGSMAAPCACRSMDDTTVPLLARGGTKTARLWTYVRDDRPWDSDAPPAAFFKFSPDRRKEHPTRHLAGWHGVLQSDVYGGYNDLYLADRKPGPVRAALCWSHARRKFFELADIKATARKGKKVAEEISPIALDAVTRIDAIFAVEREITGLSATARLDVRQQRVAPLVNDLHAGRAVPDVKAQPCRQGDQLHARRDRSLGSLYCLP